MAISNPPAIENPPWVEGHTIGSMLAESVARHGDRDALAFPKLGLNTSYAEFAAQVDAAARGLLAMGIRPGEHVAVWATNIPEGVVLQFATAKIGLVPRAL